VALRPNRLHPPRSHQGKRRVWHACWSTPGSRPRAAAAPACTTPPSSPKYPRGAATSPTVTDPARIATNAAGCRVSLGRPQPPSARAAQCAWHILGQGALYQPAQDRIPVGGVRNDVPALVTRRRNPRRDHRVAQGVDEDGLQFPLCFVVLRSEAADPFQVRAAEVEAPPRGVRRPGEQPQRQIAIGKAQVRCNVGTCSCGEAPAIDACWGCAGCPGPTPGRTRRARGSARSSRSRSRSGARPGPR
jgi:hypothetical protein